MQKRKIFSFVAALSAVGICAYITYLSKNAEMTSIIFNLSVLGVMLFMILMTYFTGLRKLAKINKGLRKGILAIKSPGEAGTDFNSVRPEFQNDYLNDCYREYRQSQSSSDKVSADISNFINEDLIESHIHRGILDLIPDLLTSIGILGTFVGLVLGLRSFNPAGYEEMANSVAPLIDGIKVAFITSIYGISLSLAYSFHLRSELSEMTERTEEFLDLHYQKIAPSYEIDSMNKLLAQQSSQDDMMKKLTQIFVEQMTVSFSKVITPSFDQMTESIRTIVGSYLTEQERIMSHICDKTVQSMQANMLDSIRTASALTDSMKASQESYTDFIDTSMSRMDQMMASIQTKNSRLAGEIESAMTQLHLYTANTVRELSSAQEDALATNRMQKETYQEYIRFMYQTIEQFSDVWNKNNETLKRYMDEISGMDPVHQSREIQESLASIASTLRSIAKKQAAHETEQGISEEQMEMYNAILRKLDMIKKEVDSPVLFRKRNTKSKPEVRD